MNLQKPLRRMLHVVNAAFEDGGSLLERSTLPGDALQLAIVVF